MPLGATPLIDGVCGARNSLLHGYHRLPSCLPGCLSSGRPRLLAKTLLLTLVILIVIASGLWAAVPSRSMRIFWVATSVTWSQRHPGLPPIPRIDRWLMGLVSALVFVVPFINLLAPVWSAAMAVHMLHGARNTSQ